MLTFFTLNQSWIFLKILFLVKHKVTTSMDQFYGIAVVDDDTVIICAGDTGFFNNSKLKTYNLTTKSKISSVDLEMLPDRIVVVNLDRNPTLAVSYL